MQPHVWQSYLYALQPRNIRQLPTDWWAFTVTPQEKHKIEMGFQPIHVFYSYIRMYRYSRTCLKLLGFTPNNAVMKAENCFEEKKKIERKNTSWTISYTLHNKSRYIFFFWNYCATQWRENTVAELHTFLDRLTGADRIFEWGYSYFRLQTQSNSVLLKIIEVLYVNIFSHFSKFCFWKKKKVFRTALFELIKNIYHLRTYGYL